jgi:hypothetical protein
MGRTRLLSAAGADWRLIGHERNSLSRANARPALYGLKYFRVNWTCSHAADLASDAVRYERAPTGIRGVGVEAGYGTVVLYDLSKFQKNL